MGEGRRSYRSPSMALRRCSLTLVFFDSSLREMFFSSRSLLRNSPKVSFSFTERSPPEGRITSDCYQSDSTGTFPKPFDLHPQLQKNSLSKEGLDLLSRRFPDLLQSLTTFANEDLLLRVLFDMDRPLDNHQVLLRMFLKRFDGHGG